MPAATMSGTVTQEDAKAKLAKVKDQGLTDKQAGFVQYIDTISDGEIQLDATTVTIVMTMYSPIWRQTPEYVAIAEELESKRGDKSTTKSLEDLKSKSPEDRKKALELALKAEQRAQERMAKIQAMMAELDGESDDDDTEDDDSF